MRIGIISPAEIAMRRFLPALEKSNKFEFAGIAVNTIEERFLDPFPPKDEMNKVLDNSRAKANTIISQFGGILYDGYKTILEDPSIDAIYIPLPPGLHYKWAKLALEKGKHVLVEKPSTVSEKDSRELTQIAEKKGLALHENYMFVYHKQLEEIHRIVNSGEIGDVRLFRISFGFPRRSDNDFRYNKALGGGALLDAGGYTIKYALYLLGSTARILYAKSNYIPEYNVDMYGSAALMSADGRVVHISFGMDNEYKCELEVWGSRGCLITGRVLTAPDGFIPTATIRKQGKDQVIKLSSDDSFLKSLEIFDKCIKDDKTRKNEYEAIVRQAHFVDTFKSLASELV